MKKDRDLHESLWRNTSEGIQKALNPEFDEAMEEVYRDGNAGLMQGVRGAVAKLRDRAEAAEARVSTLEAEITEERRDHALVVNRQRADEKIIEKLQLRTEQLEAEIAALKGQGTV